MNFLDKFSLKTKILILSAFMGLFLLAVSYSSYSGLLKVEKVNSQITEKSIPNLEILNSMALDYKEIRINLRTLGLVGLSKEQNQKHVEEVKKLIAEYEKHNNQFEKLEHTKEEDILFKELNRNWAEFRGIGVKVLNLNDIGDHEKMVQIFLADCPKAAENYDIALNKLLDYHEKRSNRFMKLSSSVSEETNQLTVVLSSIGIILTLAISILFANNASKLSEKIKEIALKIKDGTLSVNETSSKIKESSRDLSNSASDQSSSLQQTSASVEEISAMIETNSQNSKESYTLSENCLISAEKGKDAVDKLAAAIERINISSEDLLSEVKKNNQEMKSIIEMISEIEAKTKIINDIVFQTKLLSFNASIEAARAGEYGRGFSVVAEEVGKLANVSGRSSVEISELLSKSIKRVNEIVEDSKFNMEAILDKNKEAVNEGEEVAIECKNLLGEIVQAASNMSRSLSEISSASAEQSQGVQEITKAVAQLDHASQENATGAEEFSQYATGLNNEAGRLSELVTKLVETIEGNRISKNQ